MVFYSSVNSRDLAPLVELIAHRTGLHIRDADRAALARKLQERCQALGLSWADYNALLAADSGASAQEWLRLAARLANPESYFFRDRGQFQLLQQRILPELIARQRSQRRLRFWSAGCSTGEEPYSLAMLLVELLPDLEQWDCRIVGTDFNPEALARARQGWYSNWSFRALPAGYQERFFRPTHGGYQLAPRLQRWVEFQVCNLVEPLERYPDLSSQAFDLILCRNVFIYLRQSAIALALDNFARALRPEGYLLVGHAELYGQNMTGFASQVFPESILYQRCPQPPEPVAPAPRLAPPPDGPTAPVVAERPRCEAATTPGDDLAAARDRFAAKDYRGAARAAEAVLALQPQSFPACELLAQIHANAGDYNRAIQFCHKALEIEPFAVAIYYLLAQIAEESSNTEEAKAIWKKIVYLEPDSGWAHYELGHLYECEGDRKRACKMYASAQQLLTKRSPEAPVSRGVDLTVADLQRKLADKLKTC